MKACTFLVLVILGVAVTSVSARGVLIEAAGARLGAVAVSGAPGGDKDQACALKALPHNERAPGFCR